MGALASLFPSTVYPGSMLSPIDQICLGGFAFAAVFMATDPVTGARTRTGQYIYGFLIGVIAILIRVYNTGYPEGAMLAVLLMNVLLRSSTTLLSKETSNAVSNVPARPNATRLWTSKAILTQSFTHRSWSSWWPPCWLLPR